MVRPATHPRNLTLALAVLFIAAIGSAAERRDLLPCPGEMFFGDFYTAAPPPREKRREFAKMLLLRLERLDKAVPELSPAEREWLAGELSATGRRNIAANASIENQRFTARMFVNRNLCLLRRLSADAPIALREEVNFWALAAENYEDYGFARSIAALAESNVIDAEFAPARFEGVDTGQTLDFICRNQARQVMFLIIQPYLAGSLRK